MMSHLYTHFEDVDVYYLQKKYYFQNLHRFVKTEEEQELTLKHPNF